MIVSRTPKGKSIIIDATDLLCGRTFRTSISQSPANVIEQKIERFLETSIIECTKVSNNYVTELHGSNSNAIIFGSGEAYTSVKLFDELASNYCPEEIQASRPLGIYNKGWIMRFSDSDIKLIKKIVKTNCKRVTIEFLFEKQGEREAAND